MDPDLTEATWGLVQAVERLEKTLNTRLMDLNQKLEQVHEELMSIAEATTEAAEIATRQYKREIGMD